MAPSDGKISKKKLLKKELHALQEAYDDLNLDYSERTDELRTAKRAVEIVARAGALLIGVLATRWVLRG